MKADKNLSKEVLIDMAFAHHGKGNVEEEQNIYEKFIKSGFIDARVFSNLGVIYKDKGRLEEALDLTKKAIQIATKIYKCIYKLREYSNKYGKV